MSVAQRLVVAALNEAAKAAIIGHLAGPRIAAAAAQGDDIVVVTTDERVWLLTLQSAIVITRRPHATWLRDRSVPVPQITLRRPPRATSARLRRRTVSEPVPSDDGRVSPW